MAINTHPLEKVKLAFTLSTATRQRAECGAVDLPQSARAAGGQRVTNSLRVLTPYPSKT